jgi:hypothetical protein
LIWGGAMPAKSFIPQATRLARKLALYLVKHRARMELLAGDPVFTAKVEALVTAATDLAAYYIAEQP